MRMLKVTHVGIPPKYTGEEITENHKRHVRNAGGQRGFDSVWDADSRYMHQPQEGYGGTMSCSESDL